MFQAANHNTTQARDPVITAIGDVKRTRNDPNAIRAILRTVPTTKAGIFALLDFASRDLDFDLAGQSGTMDLLHSVQSALLSLNG